MSAFLDDSFSDLRWMQLKINRFLNCLIYCFGKVKIVSNFAHFEKTKINNHFTDLEQVKIDDHFANFKQVKIMLFPLIVTLYEKYKKKIY